jgi:8-amino-7-oxononanoate synthase
MPPYLAGQIRAAMELAEKADDTRDHLRATASLLRRELAGQGIDCGASFAHIVPVFCGSNAASLDVAASLQAAGFAVRAIRPPRDDVMRLAGATRSTFDSRCLHPASVHA